MGYGTTVLQLIIHGVPHFLINNLATTLINESYIRAKLIILINELKLMN